MMLGKIRDAIINLFDRHEYIPPDDVILAKRGADVLDAHYPDHTWAVNVESRHGLVKIYHLITSGNKAYVLHLDGFYSASDFDKKIKMAGGEILERYRLRRGRFDEDEWLNLPTDFAGRNIPDMH
jgi:hypothetical protein